jgi:hypothetical protein
MIEFLNIVCYKWGTKYSSKDVNILSNMIRRNLTVPHRFICITDNIAGLSKEILTAPLPEALPGNGPKIFTFSNEFMGLKTTDHVVSLDVDLVIVDNIDFLADRPEADFIIARHRKRQGDNRCHGAVYRLRVGSRRKVWDNFIADPWKAAAEFPGAKRNAFSEQFWLENQLSGDEMAFFPEEKIILFRRDCDAKAGSHIINSITRKFGYPISTARWGKARLPRIGEAIVSFAGETKPRHVIDTHYRQMRHAPFVAEHWR